MVLSDRIALLNEGQVQQCATPAVIYSEPANLFVASFIGSPPMSLLDGAYCAGLPGLGERQADSAMVGVRPANVRVSAQPVAHAIEVKVILVEPTGADLWVVGEWRDQRIKGRADPGEHVVAGQQAFFTIRPECLYLFDKANGTNVHSRGSF